MDINGLDEDMKNFNQLIANNKMNQGDIDKELAELMKDVKGDKAKVDLNNIDNIDNVDSSKFNIKILVNLSDLDDEKNESDKDLKALENDKNSSVVISDSESEDNNKDNKEIINSKNKVVVDENRENRTTASKKIEMNNKSNITNSVSNSPVIKKEVSPKSQNIISDNNEILNKEEYPEIVESILKL